jgi:hypothetical protein
MERALKHLRQTLYTLEENQFYAKMSKCVVGSEEIEYLSHIILKGRIKVHPNKIKAIKELPIPKTYQNSEKFWA